MHTLGKINELQRTLSGELLLSIKIPDTDKNMDAIESLRDKELNVDITKYTAKRSNNANRLFWKMCDQIAIALNITQEDAHDMLLRDWGVRDVFQIPKDRLETYKLTFDIIEVLDEYEAYEYGDVKVYVEAMCYVGSRFYNSAEMAYLITHTLEQAQELGINTFDEAECERLCSEWEARTR